MIKRQYRGLGLERSLSFLVLPGTIARRRADVDDLRKVTVYVAKERDELENLEMLSGPNTSHC